MSHKFSNSFFAILFRAFERLSVTQVFGKTRRAQSSEGTQVKRGGGCWMVLLAVVGGALVCHAQVAPDLEQGVKPYGSYHGGSIDQVSLNNQNLFLSAALFAYSQRGSELAYPVVLRYNNKNFGTYQPPCPSGAKLGTTQCPFRMTIVFGPAPLSNNPVSHGSSVTVGFAGVPGMGGRDVNTSLSFEGNPLHVHPSSVVMPDGSTHQLMTTSGGLAAADGSGFFSQDGVVAIDSSGTLSSSSPSGLFGSSGSVEDRNGNQMTTTLDTVGRQIPAPPMPTLPPAAPNPSTASLSACPALNYTNQSVTFAYTWNLPTVNGGTLPLILCYAGVYVRTNFLGGANGPNQFDVNKSFPMLQSVVLPDTTYWAFQYDAADPSNNSSFAFGDLLKVTFPTGGSITYTWGMWTACNSSTFSRAVQSRTVDANDGTGPHTWTYANGVVTDPLGNDTVHTFTGLGGTCSQYETKTQYYRGSHTNGILLKTITTDYTFTPNPWDPNLISQNGEGPDSVTNVLPIRVATILPNGQTSKVETDYDAGFTYHGPLDGLTWNDQTCYLDNIDSPPVTVCTWTASTTNPVTNYTASYGKAVATREYDWGTNAPGPLLRQTLTTYQWQVSSTYLTANLLNLPAAVKVLDGAGNLCAETDYFYDEPGYLTTPNPAITTQHTTAPWAVRGNLTTVTRKLSATPCAANASWTNVSSHTSWFDTGEAYQQIDPLGNITTHSYDQAYAGAYSTQTQDALGHIVSGTYDFNTGLLTSFTNANATSQAKGNTPGDSAHTTNYVYDSLWRMISATLPADSVGNHPQTTFNYPNATTGERLHKITASLTDDALTYFDGFGRSIRSKHVTAGNSLVDTTYDALGRSASVSNPYFSTSDLTYGITQTQYDALGRITQTTKQDGGISTASYFGNCTTTKDEASKARQTCTDALGRLVEVDEPGVVADHVANNSLAMQSDGNLVLYSPSKQSLWSTGTAGSNAAGFEMQDDGNLVLYSFRWSAGTYVWPPPPGPFPAADCSIGINLNAPQTLPSGKCITSPKRQYLLYMPPDGNLFIYDIAHNVGTWGTGTGGHPGAYAVMQTDGNLVVYTADGKQALWSSGTSGTNAQRLEMSDDGRIIMYRSVWNSGTSQGISTQMLAHPGCDLGTGVGQGGWLGTGQCFVSFNGRYQLLLQTDGNLVINDLGVSPVQTLWSSNTGLSPFSPGVALQTLYTYDALGNLTCVEQHGGVAGTGCSAPSISDSGSPWRVRRFTYDSLSRLLTAHNPESDTISYFYDANGNLLQKVMPSPNQTGTATHTISYCYDALNRVTGKAYSWQNCQNGQLPQGTAMISYIYDQAANGIGHLTSLTDQAGSASYSYDILGRISSEQRTIAGITKTMGYTYNLDGSVATATYPSLGGATSPSGDVITYTPDSAGRMLKAVDSANNINYVTGATYGPDNALRTFVSGQSNSFGGITNTFIYNNRLQPCRMAASSAGAVPTNCMNSWGNVLDLSYDFHLGNGDNGNVYGIINYRDQTRNQTFTYDQLNRLLSAQNAGSDCTKKLPAGPIEYWGNSYSYDAWGNLLQKAILTTSCSGENLSMTAAATNQLQGGYTYDAAGNMTHDATANLNYTFDQDNRITGASGFTYTYDADGNRVEKSSGSTGTLYWYMSLGIVGESDLLGNLKSEYIFFDDERVARKDLSGKAVSYYFSDHLKTATVITDAMGKTNSESDYYPWGGELQFINNDSNHYKFTGKERDAETGLDYFGARYYSNSLGRFITPDWAAKATAVPYVDFADPQSLNLYTYVRNIPTTRFDLDGHKDSCGFWCKTGNYLSYGVWGDEKALQAAEAEKRAELRKRQAERSAAGLPLFYLDSGGRTSSGQMILTNNIDLMNRGAVFSTSADSKTWALAASLGLGLVYQGSPKHGSTDKGDVSRAPTDGQTALNNSIQVKPTSPRRVGVDAVNDEIVVLDQTASPTGSRQAEFHGHVRNWDELTDQMRNALKRSGLTDGRGGIMKVTPVGGDED